MSRRSGLLIIMAMLASVKDSFGWNCVTIAKTDKLPTLKAQFVKRKPQGYKKHLRRKKR